MLKFLELLEFFDNLVYDKFLELLEFFDSQEEKKKKMYLEFIPFNVSFYKNITNKYEEIMKENQELKELLKETKNKCEEKDEELKEI